MIEPEPTEGETGASDRMDCPSEIAPSVEMLTTVGITLASIGAREFSPAAGIGLTSVATAQLNTTRTWIDGIN